MNKRDEIEIETAARILIKILERCRVQGEMEDERRSLLKFVPLVQEAKPTEVSHE